MKATDMLNREYYYSPNKAYRAMKTNEGTGMMTIYSNWIFEERYWRFGWKYSRYFTTIDAEEAQTKLEEKNIFLLTNS